MQKTYFLFVNFVHTVKRMLTALNQFFGVLVVYRTRMPVVTGSKHSALFCLAFYSLFYLVPSFRVNLGLD